MTSLWDTFLAKPQIKNILNKWDRCPRLYKNTGTTLGLAILCIGIYKKVTSKPKKTQTNGPLVSNVISSEDKGKKRRVDNKEFIRQLKPLLRIVFPRWASKEVFMLILHTAFLVSRTFLSIYIASLDGQIVKSIVDRNGRQFSYLLLLWLGVGIPATYVNSMIKYLESKLSIAFRTRLTEHSYKLYMKDEAYYRVGNLDSRLANADQCLTEDISKFSEKLAHLHSQLSKPILDVILMTYQLWQKANEKGKGSGWVSAIIATVSIWSTAKVLKFMQPPFGKLAAQQAQYEGELRFVQSRLITNAEEVAFYRGHQIEHNILLRSYFALIKHMNHIFRVRIFYNMLEGFFMKYVWSASGLAMLALPVFLFEKQMSNVTSDTVSTRAQDYTYSKMLLVSGAEAIERIMLGEAHLFPRLTFSFQRSERVGGLHRESLSKGMMTVFKEMHEGKFQKVVGEAAERFDISRRGEALEGDTILFEEVPIVSPNGDVLVSSLSFEVKPGMHLLISGPNGCGKSSLFRILGGLWPVYGGKVIRPAYKDMFYIPQRPYLSLGTFRDQLIYPDTEEVMLAKGKTDSDLNDILHWVSLQHILVREGGFDKMNDWKDVLSGGEKQRVGMARLLYHSPKYAILDECTSAVSIDVEGQMYQRVIDCGITLLTVTHRPTLWKYHNHLLQFDGEGGWKFLSLNATERLTYKEEKSKLESQLSETGKMQQRLRELCILLGEDSVLLKRSKSSVSDEEEERD